MCIIYLYIRKTLSAFTVTVAKLLIICILFFAFIQCLMKGLKCSKMSFLNHIISSSSGTVSSRKNVTVNMCINCSFFKNSMDNLLLSHLYACVIVVSSRVCVVDVIAFCISDTRSGRQPLRQLCWSELHFA